MRAIFHGAVVFGMLAAMPLCAQAVDPQNNGRILADVHAVHAQFYVSTWLDVEEDRNRFESNAQGIFEVGLRRDGVRVTTVAPYDLYCVIYAAQYGGVVFYHWRVSLFKMEMVGVNKLEWENGGVVTVGRRNFDFGNPASECVDAFAREWLKWNPRR